VFCVVDASLLCIELMDPTTKKRFWSLPGGKIEPNETSADAAVRETLEETGYAVSLTSDCFVSEYCFRWNAKIYECQTHWYTAKLLLDEPDPVDDADYLLQAAWLPWPEARSLLEYNPAITDAVNRFLPRR
jgi:8-oxo-dGTP pyrophosphatase MutT (NUDIX family)